MSHNPFIFNKTLQERLDEFNGILSFNLKAFDIQKHWGNYVELVIEPLGWQAMWKMSRNLCIDLMINFPCTVIVTVEEVNFKELSCVVSINEVEDVNIDLPTKMTDVPLIELFPTMEQDHSIALSLHDTAKLLDCLRFFYNHLWMPWDLEFDEDVSWVESHLERRLQLYFSLVERKHPHVIGHTVRNLVTEGRRVKQKMEDIQDQMLEDMEVEGSSGKLLQITELYNRLCEIKNRYFIYERPELLKALLERDQDREQESEVFLVLSTATSEQLHKLAKLTAQLNSDNKLISCTYRLMPSLQDALVKAPARGLVLVAAGEYPINNLASLEDGGTITGAEPGVVVRDVMEGFSTLGLLRGSLTLTALTLHMTTAWNILVLRPSVECCLREVKLEGSKVTDGVDVYPGAMLTASNCHFSNCHTAVICYTDSTVTLTGCTFADNNTALELRKGCIFSMENCTISDSKLCAVQALFLKPSTVTTISIEAINCMPQMKESGSVCKNNAEDLRFLTITREQTQIQNEDNVIALE